MKKNILFLFLFTFFLCFSKINALEVGQTLDDGQIIDAVNPVNITIKGRDTQLENFITNKWRTYVKLDDLPYANIFAGTSIDFNLSLNGNLNEDNSCIIYYSGIFLGNVGTKENCLKYLNEIEDIYINTYNIEDEGQLTSYYLGNYNGVKIIFIKDKNYVRENMLDIIGDVRINYYNKADNILAFYDNNLYSLSKTYDDELLDKNDLIFIKNMYDLCAISEKMENNYD